jgi:hypothetical protein
LENGETKLGVGQGRWWSLPTKDTGVWMMVVSPDQLVCRGPISMVDRGRGGGDVSALRSHPRPREGAESRQGVRELAAEQRVVREQVVGWPIAALGQSTDATSS